MCSAPNARHAALAAMEDPDDHFLARVASLVEADGSVGDACFQWNRVLIHVDGKRRPPRLHAHDLASVRRDLHSPGFDESPAERDPGVGMDHDAIALDAEVVDPRRHAGV